MTSFEIPNLGFNGYVAPPSLLQKNGNAIVFAGLAALLIALLIWFFKEYSLKLEKRRTTAEK